MGAFNWTSKAWYSIILILFVNILSTSRGFHLFPDDPCEKTTDECIKLFKKFEKALLQDDTNMYQMRRAFFHSPTADPVLLKVIYNVTCQKNITNAIADNTLHRCSHTPTKNRYNNIMENREMAHAKLENSDAKNQTNETRNKSEQSGSTSESLQNEQIDCKQRNYTYGWTSTGVYTVLHPMVLNMVQAQAPFVALRIVHLYILQDQRSPEADTFLWDGSYDLPTLNLNLHITDLPCTPSQNILEYVLIDINTHVSIQHVQYIIPNKLVIGHAICIQSQCKVSVVYAMGCENML